VASRDAKRTLQVRTLPGAKIKTVAKVTRFRRDDVLYIAGILSFATK
jgi:hypothetical protein